MPPRVKTPEERQQIKMLILDAARQLFVERGIEAVSMREIAKRMTYSPTTIYLHFTDKNDLLQTLCHHDFLVLASELQAISSHQQGDAIQQLKDLCTAYARYALAHPNHYRFMFMTPKPGDSKDASKNLRGNVEQDAYALLRHLVKHAFEQQVFRPELDNIDLLAQTLWAGIHGICTLQITMPNDNWVDWQPIEQRVALMQDTLIRGLTRPYPAH